MTHKYMVKRTVIGGFYFGKTKVGKYRWGGISEAVKYDTYSDAKFVADKVWGVVEEIVLH